MRLNFPFRKLIVVTACCAASVVALMSPVHAYEEKDPFIRDSLVGQSAAPEESGSTASHTQLRDSLIGQVPGDDAERAMAADSARWQAQADAYLEGRDKVSEVPFIRDSQIGQVPAVSEAEPGPAVAPRDDTDWVVLGTSVLLALLMGIAGTLGIEYYLGSRRRTA